MSTSIKVADSSGVCGDCPDDPVVLIDCGIEVVAATPLLCLCCDGRRDKVGGVLSLRAASFSAVDVLPLLSSPSWHAVLQHVALDPPGIAVAPRLLGPFGWRGREFGDIVGAAQTGGMCEVRMSNSVTKTRVLRQT